MRPRDPYRAVTIFHDCFHSSSRSGYVRELSVRPVCESRVRADPETPIAGRIERSNAGDARWKLLTGWRIPRQKTHPVESIQSALRSSPDVAIGCLCEGGRSSAQHPILYTPDRMSVLRDAAFGIERQQRLSRRGEGEEDHEQLCQAHSSLRCGCRSERSLVTSANCTRTMGWSSNMRMLRTLVCA